MTSRINAATTSNTAADTISPPQNAGHIAHRLVHRLALC